MKEIIIASVVLILFAVALIASVVPIAKEVFEHVETSDTDKKA